MTEGLKLCVVSEWMDHGNLHTYLKDNEVADRTELVSRKSRPRCISDSLGYSCLA
jgi:hypothetical protein